MTVGRLSIGTVERALGIFQQLGLVEQLHGGLLYMTDIELMIGQSSTEAERKRAARLANKALPPPRTNGGHLSDNRPPEIEIKKEIDMLAIMLPAFLLAMYEKDGLPFEKVIRNIVRVKFTRPGIRPYRTENIYAPFARKEEPIEQSKKAEKRK